MYKKILIATDGKHHSSSAIIEAIEIARKFSSEIYLLHALKKMVVSDQFGISHSVIAQKLKESTKKYMETFKGLAIDDGVVKFEIFFTPTTTSSKRVPSSGRHRHGGRGA